MKLKYKPHRGRRISLTVGWNAKVKLYLMADSLGISPSELAHHLILATEFPGWEEIEKELSTFLDNRGTVGEFLRQYRRRKIEGA